MFEKIKGVVRYIYKSEELVNAAETLLKNNFMPVKSPLWTDSVFGGIAWVLDKNKAPCVYFDTNTNKIAILLRPSDAEELRNTKIFKELNFEMLYHYSDCLDWLESKPLTVEEAIESYKKIINII